MLGRAKPRRLDEPIAVSLEASFPRATSTATSRRARPGLRPGMHERPLCRAGPPQHRPRRLFQAPARHVLRGDPLRAQAHRDRQPQPGPPVVSRLRPRRGASRPLQPDPHPAAPRHRRLRALLREGRDLCQEAGLVRGRELYVDASKVEANADADSLIPRFAHDAKTHVADLFAADPARDEHQEQAADPPPGNEVASPEGGRSAPGSCPGPTSPASPAPRWPGQPAASVPHAPASASSFH